MAAKATREDVEVPDDSLGEPDVKLSTFALTLFRKEVEFDDENGKRVVKIGAISRGTCQMTAWVFDVTRKVTYQNLANWYKELREYCETIPCFLVANKIDVDMNKVTSKKFKFAETHNLEFSFVSAADGTNVVRVFKDAVEAAVKFKREGGDFMSDVLDLLGEEARKLETCAATLSVVCPNSVMYDDEFRISTSSEHCSCVVSLLLLH
ncbi:hypothetical protein BBJ28_00004758 [Nothophytophthora sp. Chile5]|nr:hypothetical protein BBJ28_00004758 [Nothophytophthora sp. Chile5]